MRLHHKLIMLSAVAFALPAGADEKVAFLGVKTTPVHPTLAAQLELEENAGLTVGATLKGGPAEDAGILEHDILAAFNGTPLTSPTQLRELVMSREPGDEIELTIIRKAKEESVKVKLGKLPEREFAVDPAEAARGMLAEGIGGLKLADPRAAKMLEDLMKKVDPDGVGGGFPGFPGGGFPRLPDLPDFPDGAGTSSHSSMSMNDSSHQIELETRDGMSTLTVHDTDGKLLYDGPYNTEDEKAAVPEDVRKKVDSIKSDIRIIPGFPRIPKKGDAKPIVPPQKRTI